MRVRDDRRPESASTLGDVRRLATAVAAGADVGRDTGERA
jgi:hypothetical protein